MHIGIAGVGRMGSNMTLRLMEGGHKLTVWNRSAEKLKPLQDAGASVAKTPAELASAVEAIITIVTNADAIDTVYHGKDGLLSADRARCRRRLRVSASARCVVAGRHEG